MVPGENLHYAKTHSSCLFNDINYQHLSNFIITALDNRVFRKIISKIPRRIKSSVKRFTNLDQTFTAKILSNSVWKSLTSEGLYFFQGHNLS